MKTTEKQITEFTAQQLDDWQAFEDVRAGGRYNMFDPRARHATGLSEEEYRFVMRNFSPLKAAVEAKAMGGAR